jgi:hypothetical protein
MAALKSEVKAYIVQMVACYDSPTQVMEAVQKEFGIAITRQQVESHDPTKVSGRGLAKKWVDMFHLVRERFQRETSDIPIANKSYRLRVLNRMSLRAEEMKNLGMTAQLLEQAAKECGDAFTNRQKLEHSGPGGGAIETITMNKEDYKAARQEMMEDDDC